MTYIYTSRLHFALLFLILCFQRCCSAAAPSVQCKIMNFEYVECIWQPNTSTINYTFSSAFANDNVHEDCPKYILDKDYTVGCRIPLKKHELKFKHFYTVISTEGNYSISKTSHSLLRNVQLKPPCNLSAIWNDHSDTLSLHWNSTTPVKKKCIVYMLHIRKDSSQFVNLTEPSYTLSQVSQSKLYVFQVRSTVAESCGSLNMWSDWSVPVEWRGTGNSNWFYVVLSVSLLLALLGLLLWICERKKNACLSVVPDPSKNLQDLFHKHDGNVESWIHISKELKEAFQPDYHEPSCDVCEVSPACDSSPKTEACPAPQTDNCDKADSDEEPAEQQS